MTSPRFHPDDGLPQVMSRPCATCILRPGGSSLVPPDVVKDLVERHRAVGAVVTCHQTLPNIPGSSPALGYSACAGYLRAFPDIPAARVAELIGGWHLIDPPASPKESPMTDTTTPTARPNVARMRDARYLRGELVGVGELKDLHGRRFTPRSFRATWERQGGSAYPWELRVTVQGPSILKGGGIGEKVRSLLFEDVDAPEERQASATFRMLPDWLRAALVDLAPHPMPQTQELEAETPQERADRDDVARAIAQASPIPGLGTQHGMATGDA